MFTSLIIFQIIIFTRQMSKTFVFLIYFLYLSSAILDRTYYDALQLPVSASQDEIRDAFRKLSKKYHPDRNPDAKSKFQQINNAYQALYDTEKKFLYDRVGKEKMSDPNVFNEFNLNAMKGPQLKIKVPVELKDFYLGKKLKVTVQKQVACPHCKGTGAQNPYDIVTCRDCQGKGRTTRRVDLGGGYYNLFTQTCQRCGGRGKVIGRKCHLCKQQKIIPGIQQFNLKIQPGTASNEALRYMNMGDQRMLGAPSDIVFELSQIKHPYLTRQGKDLKTQITITLQQAIFGFKKTIKHLDERQVEISSESITQPGSTKIITGQGMPDRQTGSKGDLYVKINVHIPLFTEQQIKGLRQFFQTHKSEE